MLPWIRRLGDWLMPDIWPLNRHGPQPQALHYSSEKAGLSFHDQPIPWNADAVVVEAVLRLPPAARRKTDFTLRLPDRDPIAAENLRPLEGEDRWRVTFRLPPPPATTAVELRWREHSRGSLTLPILSREEFLQAVRLQLPTLSVRLGEEYVACQTFVSTQCKGLQATALLSSGTVSLAPLLDLDLQVEFASTDGAPQRVPVRLCSSQLAGKQALVTASPRKVVRRMTGWTVRWLLADRELATQQVRGIGLPTFRRSLRLSDTRFVIQDKSGSLSVSRQAPPMERVTRLGPLFLLASGEPGMAGFCSVQVHVQVTGSIRPPLLFDQEVLVTDGPTVVAPGTLDAADLEQVTGFDIRVKGHSLGVLPLSPAPTAAFTSEGGFKPPSDFVWSASADEELNERLTRLLNGRGS